MNIPKELIEQWIKEGSGYTQTAQRAVEWHMQQLVGVDMEPVAYSYTKRHVGLGDMEALSFSQKPNCIPLYTATQLAAARLQGAEEETNKTLEAVRVAGERIAELEATNEVLRKDFVTPAADVVERVLEKYGYYVQTKRIAELEAQVELLLKERTAGVESANHRVDVRNQRITELEAENDRLSKHMTDLRELHTIRMNALQPYSKWYEELRQATDGGSESMTHEDAIAHVEYLSDAYAGRKPLTDKHTRNY
jgi:hypothetical protein